MRHFLLFYAMAVNFVDTYNLGDTNRKRPVEFFV